MAAPRNLSRPPIVEALIHFRSPIPGTPEAFEAFAREIQPPFSDVQVRRGVRAELKVENGKLIAPKAEMLGFQGVVLSNADGTVKAQIGPAGFTFNNLRPYMGGERLVNLSVHVGRTC